MATQIVSFIMACSFLFASILASTFTYALINILVKLVLLIIFRKESKEIKNLKKQITDLKAESHSLNMVDEFAAYAKTQRKIRKCSDDLANENNIRASAMVKVKVASSIFLHILCGVFAFYLLFYYRYVPVLKVPSGSLYPFNKIMAFPMESTDTIGITIWLAVSSTVAKIVVNSIF